MSLLEDNVRTVTEDNQRRRREVLAEMDELRHLIAVATEAERAETVTYLPPPGMEDVVMPNFATFDVPPMDFASLIHSASMEERKTSVAARAHLSPPRPSMGRVHLPTVDPTALVAIRSDAEFEAVLGQLEASMDDLELYYSNVLHVPLRPPPHIAHKSPWDRPPPLSLHKTTTTMRHIKTPPRWGV